MEYNEWLVNQHKQQESVQSFLRAYHNCVLYVLSNVNHYIRSFRQLYREADSKRVILNTLSITLTRGGKEKNADQIARK